MALSGRRCSGTDTLSLSKYDHFEDLELARRLRFVAQTLGKVVEHAGESFLQERICTHSLVHPRSQILQKAPKLIHKVVAIGIVARVRELLTGDSSATLKRHTHPRTEEALLALSARAAVLEL
jgi:hypothetical protein